MLALIAGQGRLPEILVEAARPGLLVALEGHSPDHLTPDMTFRIERLGTLLRDLGKAGVEEVCFAGALHRPKIEKSKIDMRTLPLVPRMMKAIASGDDAVLRAVLETFTEAGFRIRAAHDLAPSLLPGAGVLTSVFPDDRAKADAERAARVISALGAVDVGQACIVSKGQAIALETIAGTDWMLRMTAFGRGRLPDQPPGLLAFGPGVPVGGVLFKAPKPGQDRRIDLPVIGPETMRAAAAAGLSGVVIEAGGVMVLDREETIAAAEAAGLFLWIRSP